jgi:hypothetical protein
MIDVVYKPLSGLVPVELKYEYSRNEKLNLESFRFNEGLSFNTIKGLNDFQDVAINKNTCLALTNTIFLSSVFEQPYYKNSIARYPTSIKASTRDNPSKHISYNSSQNVLIASEINPSSIYLNPVKNTREVEIFIDGKYLQIENSYPYKAYLQEESLDPEEIQRQRFSVTYQEGFISFKILTPSGFRYLSFGVDGILRATGAAFNNTIINDYIFKCEILTDDKTVLGFVPSNDWVAYYSDNQNAENRTVNIELKDPNVLTNFLLDFPIERTAKTGVGYINLANLKTNVSPVGHPSPII